MHGRGTWVACCIAAAAIGCADGADGNDTRGNGISVAPPAAAQGGASGGGSGAVGSAGMGLAGVSGTLAGGSGAGVAGAAPVTGGAGGQAAPTQMAGTGGAQTPGAMAGTGGGSAGTGASGTGGAPAGGGESVAGIPEAELEMLRQVCVDTINMYRATLSLPPIPRATPEQEVCSDRGSMKDADSGRAHSSAGAGNPCVVPPARYGSFPYFGSQNTCPGYPVGRFGGATIADALKRCLQQMWAEGEPPEGEAECMRKYREGDTACFLAHGHYLNMKNAQNAVSCGFYNMGNDEYWMNQDFTSR